jgi:hypothetical protein
MNFELTDRGKDYLERVTALMEERIYPAEPVYVEQMRPRATRTSIRRSSRRSRPRRGLIFNRESYRVVARALAAPELTP